MPKIFVLLLLGLQFSVGLIKSGYFSKMTLDKDKIQDLPEDCGSKKTIDKPWLFTSKSIMCAVYCQSVEEDCEVTKYAGNNECHFIHRNVVSEGMLTKDLGNSVEMHSSQPLTATDSNNPDIALDKNIAAGSVDPNTSPPETIVSDIRAQCFNSTPPDLFCTLNTDSYFTVDLASIKNIATIRFWTAASTQNAQTIKLADIYIGNNGTTQGDPVEKKNIFQTEQLNANQKKDVHFDPKVAGRFITVVGQQRICVQYFQVFSDPK